MQVIKSDKLSSPWEARFIIVDESGNVLDDAQGYGYTSAEKAHRAWGWKTNKKARRKDKGIAKWWRRHKEFKDRVNDLFLINAKEICRGEVTDGDLYEAVKEIAEEMGIDGFGKEVFKRFEVE